MYLSKTDFLLYLQCPKCLWLKKKKPELYTPPIFTDYEKNKLREGQRVEALARKLFHKGFSLSGKVENLVDKTKKLISQKKSQIFQATFIADRKLLTKIDILEYDSELDCWNIYEVKSSTKVNTDREHNHIRDIAFQKIVLEKSSVAVGKTFLIHLNKNYRKRGKLDIDKLFTITDISKEVNIAYDRVTIELNEALSFLKKDYINLNSCSCVYLIRKNHCSCFQTLNYEIPDYSVHDISRINTNKLKELINEGIFDVIDIPTNFELSGIQRKQVCLAQTRKPQINIQNIQKFINKLEYPIYFFDYETYAPAIPVLNDFSPYKHIPFQVSVHILESDGDLRHFEYLAENIENTVVNLIAFMRKTISPKGSIISWHASFEKKINREILKIYPEHSSFLLGMNHRIFDLEDVFKDDYSHPDFKGKTSIKKILPILVPRFSYTDLNIQGGTGAMENWRKITFDDISDNERIKIKENLLEYCKMDTLAMVEIFKHLQLLN